MSSTTTFLVTLLLAGAISTTARAESYARQAVALRASPAATAGIVDRVDANQSLQIELANARYGAGTLLVSPQGRASTAANPGPPLPGQTGRDVMRGLGTLAARLATAGSEEEAESELFGHEKGAFTGATATRLGAFETADGGTLFLDEIGDLSPALQVKLLRVLQERAVVRVGASLPRQVDVRILAATHRDLTDDVKAHTSHVQGNQP